MRIRGTQSLLLVLSCAVAFAQGTTSRVVGTVTDASGAVVPQATVKLVNEGTRVTFTTNTSTSGTYVFEAVQPGAYEVDVEADGFRKFISHNNEVGIGLPTTVNVKLDIGAVTDQVTVEATAEAVQTSTSGNLGQTVAEQAVEDLPIVGTRGRNPLDIIFSMPGVVNGAPTGGTYYVHGARDRSWNYTLDGIDINDSSQGGSNSTSFRPNPDMLDEFRVVMGNNTAEWGRNSGGQVAMMTRSGTNEYHGDGFWFYRTPRLNANEWQNNLAHVGKAQLAQNIFGGGVGGPIWKNHTFFFAEIQGLRARSSTLTTRTVFTDSARQGILRYVKGGRNQPAQAPGASVDTNGNVLPGVNIGTYNVAQNDPQHFGLNPQTLQEIKNEPEPNAFYIGDGLNTAGFNFTPLAAERQHDQTIKIDQVINSKNTFYARFAWGNDDSNCDIVNSGQPVFPGGVCLVNTVRRPRNYAFNWRSTPSSSLTNEFVLGYNRYPALFGSPADISKVTWFGTPVDNTQQFDFGNQRIVSTWQFVDNLNYIRGAHSFKFGFNLRRVREEDLRGGVAGLNATEELSFSTSVNTVDPATFNLPSDLNTSFDRPNFSSDINFMLGRVGTIQEGFVNQGGQFTKGQFQFDTRYPEYEFYGQDTWKVRRNLTLDLGLRWEIRLSPNTPSNNILVPNQPMVAGGLPSNTVQWVPGNLFKSRFGNLGPSIGFAWDPSGSGKTSVRGNYRIAYDRINDFVIASTILPLLPGGSFGVVNTAFGQSGGRLSGLPTIAPPAYSAALTTPAPFASNSNTVIDPNLKTPTTHQFTFDIQREVARDTVLDVAYVGRRAYHLLGAYNVNQAQILNNGFLDAFNTVKAGGDSPLMDRLLTGDSRLNAGETGSQMVRRLYASNLNLNSVGGLAGSIAARLQPVGSGSQSVTQISAGLPFYFFAYPQFSGGLNVLDSNDFSTYNALEVTLKRRLKNGITYNLSYTWSKSLDTRSFDPTLTVVGTTNASTAADTPFDINNRKLNYAISDFNRPHSLNWNFLDELPFGRGKKWLNGSSPLLNRIVGGWEIAGYGRVTSGRPFTVFAGTETVSSVNYSTANCTGCSRGMGTPFLDSASGLIWFFNQQQRAMFTPPGAGQFGNTGRNAFNAPHYFELDASLLKRIPINERFKLELRAEATNLTNSVSFAAPTTDITSSIFGRINNSVSSSSRKIQLGAKLHF